jgi:hypothetical protein
MTPHRTFLAPGQRYAEIVAEPWPDSHHLTILQIAEPPGEDAVVTYRRVDGDLETTSTANFEVAIARGVLVPVVGTGRIGAC